MSNDPQSSSELHQTPLFKDLAVSDPKTRDQAVINFRAYISRSQNQFDRLKWLQIWKGLFFCLWMSDRPLTQQRLAHDLANFIQVVSDDHVFPFLHAFWSTMAREWNNIDSLRMNKFLQLIRFSLRSTFNHLSNRDWRPRELIQQHHDLISSIPLHPTDPKIPNGLKYHVVDVYLDELLLVLTSSSLTSKENTTTTTTTTTTTSGDTNHNNNNGNNDHNDDKDDEEDEKHVSAQRKSLMQIMLEPLLTLKKIGRDKILRRLALDALNDDRIEDWIRSGVSDDGK